MKFLNNFKVIKKITGFLLTGIAVFAIIAFFAFAQTGNYPFQYGTDRSFAAPDITSCSNSIKDCIIWIFSLVFNTLIYVAGALAVIMFAWAGISYITKPTDAANIHKRIYWGVIGLIVALASFGIVKFIEFNLTRNTQAFITPFNNIAYAQTISQANPLDRFAEGQERIRPAGIAGCQNAKSIFTYITGQGLGDVPSGLLGTCILGFLGTKLLPVIYTIALLWSVGVFIWIGLEYVQSKGDVKNLHQRLLWGIIGVAITVMAFSLVKAIEISLTTPETVSSKNKIIAEKCLEETTLRERLEQEFPEMIALRQYGDASLNSYSASGWGYKIGLQELIYTKALAEEIKCETLNAGKNCANDSCIKDQKGWAKKIREKIEYSNKYSDINASQLLQQYYNKFPKE